MQNNGYMHATNAYISGEVHASSGSIDGSLVTSGINAGNITTGTLSAARIAAGSIAASKLVVTDLDIESMRFNGNDIVYKTPTVVANITGAKISHTTTVTIMKGLNYDTVSILGNTVPLNLEAVAAHIYVPSKIQVGFTKQQLTVLGGKDPSADSVEQATATTVGGCFKAGTKILMNNNF